MDGDQKGLQRMKHWAKEDHGKTADERPAESSGSCSHFRRQRKEPYSNG
jgi:hypothetical protein